MFHFTWYKHMSTAFNSICFLFANSTIEEPCTNCISGPQSCPPDTCDSPFPQEHGDWFCPPSSDPPDCHLECHPGYVSTNKTVITCEDGQWSEAPECVAAVAIITGGGPFCPTVEVYGENLHKKLPDLPDSRYYHSLQLVNGVLLLCGGAINL